MQKKNDRRLRIGGPGYGQIAQVAHFESCTGAATFLARTLEHVA